MKGKFSFSSYKGFSREELEKLPVKELAQIAHEAIKEWDKLNQKLNQDSTNSNKAPSTDSPEVKAQRKAEEKASTPKRGGRKQGAQPGHKAASRPLIPLKDGDIIVDCKPEVCTHCGESLDGYSDPEPYRQQQYDVEIIRRITEYRKHKIACQCCGGTTEGTLPAVANESAYSPDVAALVVTLTGLFHMSRRMAKLFIEDIVGIPISVGSVSNLEKEITQAAKPVMEEIEMAAQSAPHGNADETGFGMKNGQLGWLWVLVTQSAVLFRMYLGRGQEWASRLLGCFAGILTTDRWGGYNRYPSDKRQICWSHLIRDFRFMCGTGADGEAIGAALRKAAREMFRLWHRFKKWKNHLESKGIMVSMTVLESRMQAIRARIKVLLTEGAKRGVPKCGTILKVEPLLWRFTQEKDIEPTNNIAEQSIRPAVLWKKRSFGVESERGAQYVESMLSIWATSRRNGVNPIAFVRELIHSYRTKSPAPSIFYAPSCKNAYKETN
jgi:transposase